MLLYFQRLTWPVAAVVLVLDAELGLAFTEIRRNLGYTEGTLLLFWSMTTRYVFMTVSREGAQKMLYKDRRNQRPKHRPHSYDSFSRLEPFRRE
jgi:hypothetical protein